MRLECIEKELGEAGVGAFADLLTSLAERSARIEVRSSLTPIGVSSVAAWGVGRAVLHLQAKRIQGDRLIERAIGIVPPDVRGNIDPSIGPLDCIGVIVRAVGLCRIDDDSGPFVCSQLIRRVEIFIYAAR